tara:strand:+ start:6997 stop:7530 length:534 start_codon:yes stop_codon:yes gene_type:complete
MAFGAVSTSKTTYLPTSEVVSSYIQAALNSYFSNEISKIFTKSERILKTKANTPVYSYPSSYFGVKTTLNNRVIQTGGYALYGGHVYWFGEGGYIPSGSVSAIASQLDLEKAFNDSIVARGVAQYVAAWLKTNMLTHIDKPTVDGGKEYVYALAYKNSTAVQAFLPAPPRSWDSLPK